MSKRKLKSGDRMPEEKWFSSGDRSGKGRPRRDDGIYPLHRSGDQMGTHGGSRGKSKQGRQQSKR